MAGSIAPHRHALKINRIAMMWLYPRLRELPPEAWESMLGKARATDFETAEWIGNWPGGQPIREAQKRLPVA